MHSFGDSFGFRRSDEFLWSGAEGNFKTPDSGTLLQGDLVEIDPDESGYLKVSAANAPLIPGVRGLLIQYGQLYVSAGLTRNVIFNTRDLSQVINDAAAVICTGAGIKVWVENLAAVTATNQRQYSAETRCSVTDVEVGGLIAWDGAKYVHTATAANAVGYCTLVGTSGFEFVLSK